MSSAIFVITNTQKAMSHENIFFKGVDAMKVTTQVFAENKFK